jgi:hypothetical protein
MSRAGKHLHGFPVSTLTQPKVLDLKASGLKRLEAINFATG